MSLDVARIVRFDRHSKTCEVCKRARYAYLGCPDGRQLARQAITPLTYAERQAR